ncbi:methyltransferase, TIGR04325 family [Urbifossiella limnaea]|uniref:methyltransferase, TIGR04325 family n=1 Tax=Urbifossiella limnaea TaxID=2528023 RepID=UPI00192E57B5|nr:methyltransferase, TIGR04325 family [Urbifossiella limnaea]
MNRSPLVLARAAFNSVLGRFHLREYYHRGAFATYQEALAAVRPGLLAGYDNDGVADVSFEKMCRIALWDWPVLYWLRRLIPESRCVLDAGGHQGTKFRAFGGHLELDGRLRWVVYDVPAVVRAGRARTERDGLRGLEFVDSLDAAPEADIFLASGLLQYLDVPLGQLLGRLPARPRHLLLNKVATREGPTVVTLERFPRAEVPYQIRNRAEFLSALDAAGYDVVDEWEIPNLAHEIPTHPHLGKSTSRGWYAVRRS